MSSTIGYCIRYLMYGGIIINYRTFHQYCQKDGKVYLLLRPAESDMIPIEKRMKHEVPFSYLIEAIESYLEEQINKQLIINKEAAAVIKEELELFRAIQNYKPVLSIPTQYRHLHIKRAIRR